MRVSGIPNVRTCIAPLRENIIVSRQDKYGTLPELELNQPPLQHNTTELLIIGAGPAGLSAALSAADQGTHILLIDENPQAGGQLIKQTHKFFGSKNEKAGTRGITIAQELSQKAQEHTNITFLLDTTAIGYYEPTKEGYHTFLLSKRYADYTTELIHVDTKTAILATGATENMLLFPGNDLPGVYGAGGVQTLMNVFGVKPGKRVVMVGAGNVGLIVSYQLLQAGIDVACVVEAAPRIGGYHVHAAKLLRCGVPILTSHSIKEVKGKDHVTSCTIIELDDNWQEKPNTEQQFYCDTVCLAVGLTPSTRLIEQTNSAMAQIPEAGGYVALHDEAMKTTIPGIYIAGDASGIEEASTAMIEGQIAGLNAAESLGYDKNIETQKQQATEALNRLRAGPFGEKPREAKQRITQLRREEK